MAGRFDNRPCRETPLQSVSSAGRAQRRGPSMYEMEGPRLAPLPWSADCSATAGPAATTGFKIPPSAPVARPSRVPRVAPRADPFFSGERFLLPSALPAQGLCATTSRFFCHPQDIRCLSPVHNRFPPPRPQVYPQPGGNLQGWPDRRSATSGNRRERPKPRNSGRPHSPLRGGRTMAWCSARLPAGADAAGP
jgi:hypothetical protein